MMTIFKRFWLFIALFSGFICTASPLLAAKKIDPIVLMAERAVIGPYESMTVVLDYGHTKGWHSYFENPGETGQGARISWTMPEGVTSGPLIYPLPEKLNLLGVIAYGYSGQTSIVTQLKNTTNTPISIGDISAEINLLVCADLCIPEKHQLSLLTTHDAPSLIKRAIDALPQAAPDGVYEASGRKLRFAIKDLGRPVIFFSTGDTLSDPKADQIIIKTKGGYVLETDALEPDPIAPFSGVLQTDKGAYRLNFTKGSVPEAVGLPILGFFDPAILIAAVLAFFGGMVLNLMPCVFPVLSFKLMALSKAGQDRAKAISEALFYALGVVLSFVALALVIEAIKGAGTSAGWGFQLQNPWVSGALALLMALVGLNMLGLFSVGGSLQRLSGGLMVKDGPLGSLLTGVLAVVVAAPCTAPFMATAVGVALSQGGGTAIFIFVALGLGFALPMVLLTLLIACVPAISRLWPKPGPWMVQLQRAMGLLMILSALWLGYVFYRQMTPETPSFSDKSAHMTYSPENLSRLRAQNRPVLVILTADWCVTCKVNERLVLYTPEVLKAAKEKDVTFMVGDWTRSDDEITRYLQSFGREGVPLYIYYPKDAKEPVILPVMPSKADLISRF